MIKAILFDFWGTLVEQGVPGLLRESQRILQVQLPFSHYVVRLEKAMMTGMFPDLRSAFVAVAAEFNLDCSEKQIEQLVGLWNKSWMLAVPYEEVEEVLRAWKGKYTLILISNTDCFSVEKVLEKYAGGTLFDKMYLSYQQGILKTDPEFYPRVLGEMGLQASEVVVVGDSMESDIAPAQRAGLAAVLMDRRNRREVEMKIENMLQLQGMMEAL